MKLNPKTVREILDRVRTESVMDTIKDTLITALLESEEAISKTALIELVAAAASPSHVTNELIRTKHWVRSAFKSLVREGCIEYTRYRPPKLNKTVCMMYKLNRK